MEPRDEAYRGKWKELWGDYCQETTLHGAKYVTSAGKYRIRRVVWLLVIILAAVIMVYFAADKLVYFFKYPTTVSVEVNYNSSMAFPAVTVCSTNPYRLTALQESGLYDTMKHQALERKIGDQNADLTEQRFRHVVGICAVPARFRGKHHVLLKDTTRTVCASLCHHFYGGTCSSVLYDSRMRSCVLSPYTGSVDDVRGDCPQHVEFYRRQRDVGLPEDTIIECSFELQNCPLANVAASGDSWQRSMASSGEPTLDHTLRSAEGHYLWLPLTAQRSGYSAETRTAFIRTTGLCATLYTTSSGNTQLDVGVMDETLTRHPLFAATDPGTDMWMRIFLPLPNGVFQVYISGRRGNGTTSITIDDVMIAPCARSYENCRRIFDGSDYLGKTNVTSSATSCQPWSISSLEGDTDFSDESKMAAENFCRNPSRDPRGLWCYTNYPESKYCDVPACACSAGQHQCGSGKCIPRDLLCDGRRDCEDGSDELEPCASHISVTCGFEDAFLCGYTVAPRSAVPWQRVRQAAPTATHRPRAASTGRIKDYYLFLGALAVAGDSGAITSPPLSLPRPAQLTFSAFTEAHVRDTVTQLTVNRLSPSGAAPTLLAVVRPTPAPAARWRRHTLCLPAGSYRIQFAGAIGGVGYQALALDDVTLHPNITCTPTPPVLDPLSPHVNPSQEVSINDQRIMNPLKSGACFINPVGDDYRGSLAVTETGLPCQRWDRSYPHAHAYPDQAFVDGSKKAAQNYCRNPGGVNARPWCYTTDPAVEWQHCKLFRCPYECINGDGFDYVGKLNITQSGKTCQRWNSNKPHLHAILASHFLVKNLTQNENYCRNPDGESSPWCYTTDQFERWAHCNLPQCSVVTDPNDGSSFQVDIETQYKTKECLDGAKGLTYQGKVNVSLTGIPCQRWDSTSPNYHRTRGEYLPDGDLMLAADFCRNPDSGDGGGKRPWCYLLENSQGWEWNYCDIPICNTSVCYYDSLGVDYSGTVSVTDTGLTCQRWDHQSPQSHSIQAQHVVDSNLSDAANYCRNPTDTTGGKPWCYTTTPGIRWESCNVSRCPLNDGAEAAAVQYDVVAEELAVLQRLTQLQANRIGCYVSASGTDYLGTVSHTETGLQCQAWAAQTPHIHGMQAAHIPDQDLLQAVNYCRNPDRSKRPWCYTTDPLVRWQYCNITQCQHECYLSEFGSDYRGPLSAAVTGEVCLPWTLFPGYTFPYPESAYPHTSTCRNPDLRAHPWCHVVRDGAVTWEYCELSPCADWAGPDREGNYTETRNQTLGCGFDSSTMCGMVTWSSSEAVTWGHIPRMFLSDVIRADHEIVNTEGLRGSCTSYEYFPQAALKSPGFPVDYPNKVRCTHHVLQPPGSVTNVTFTLLDLEDDPSCRFDSIKLFGSHDYAFTLNPVCGSHAPPPFTTLHTNLTVSFVSDYSATAGGYVINYQSTSPLGIDSLLAVRMALSKQTMNVYSSVLTSPELQVTVDSCLRLQLYLNLLNGKLTISQLQQDGQRTLLFETHQSFGEALNELQVDVPSSNKPIRLELVVSDHGERNHYLLALDDLRITEGMCTGLGAGSVDCDFSAPDLCGYTTPGVSKWDRVTLPDPAGIPQAMMRVYFSGLTRGPITLASPSFPTPSPACLSISHRALSPDGFVILEVLLLPQRFRGFVTLSPSPPDASLTPFRTARVVLPPGDHQLQLRAFGSPGSSISVTYITMETGLCRHLDAIMLQPMSTLATIPMMILHHLMNPSNDSLPTTSPPPTLSNASAILPPGHGLQLGEALDSLGIIAPYHSAHFDLMNFTMNTGPNINDLIASCTWNADPCDPAMITPTFTDLGVCYTFNGQVDSGMQATRRGSAFGLKLTLNMASYEHVLLPNTYSSFKVQLHSQNDIPLPRDMGFMVGPGFRYAGGINSELSKNLGPPYDDCGEKYLASFPNQTYSIARCQTDCAARQLTSRCGCRDADTPITHGENETDLCDFESFMTCVLPYRLYNSTVERCECPDACDVQRYYVDLSSASLRGVSPQYFLGTRQVALQQQLTAATNTRHRVEAKNYTTTLSALSQLRTALYVLVTSYESKVINESTSLIYLIEQTVAEIASMVANDLRSGLNREMAFFMDAFVKHLKEDRDGAISSLIRAREAVLDLQLLLAQKLSTKPSVYKEGMRNSIIYDIARAIELASLTVLPLMDMGQTYKGTKVPLYFVPPESGLVERCAKAGEDLRVNAGQLVEGLGILAEGKYYPDMMYASRFVTSSDILLECLRYYGLYLSNTNDWIKEANLEIAQLQDRAFGSALYEKAISFSEESMDNIAWMDELVANYSANMIGTSELHGVIDTGRVRALIADMDHEIVTLRQQVLLPLLGHLGDMKTRLARLYRGLMTRLLQLQVFFTDHGQHATIERIATQLQLWKRPRVNFQHAGLVVFELMQSETWRSWPPTMSLALFTESGDADTEITEIIDRLLNDPITYVSDLDLQLTSLHIRATDAVAALTRHLQAYEETILVNEQFILDNFLTLDIYFMELKYQLVIQQPAYDLAMFFGDMGGLLGLFLGASIITLVELLDFMVVNAYEQRTGTVKRPPAPPSHHPNHTSQKNGLTQSLSNEQQNPIYPGMGSPSAPYPS